MGIGIGIGSRDLGAGGTPLNDQQCVAGREESLVPCPPSPSPGPLLFTTQDSPSLPQLLQALHRLTRLAVFQDLSTPEAVLALFPANFHQNLKNLLTKIILENM